MKLLHNTALREQLAETLTPIFGQFPTFFSDSPTLVEWLRSVDIKAYEFKDANDLSLKERKNIVAIGTDTGTLPRHKEWHAAFRNSRLLMIPLLSFDPSLESAIYTMQLLAQSAFEYAVSENERWLKLLLERSEPFIFSGKGCDIVCEIGEDVCILRPRTTIQMLPGEWDSIGAFFEVGMVPQPEDIQPAFTVNGTVIVPGVAVAHHRQMHESILPLVTRAWELFQDVRKQNLFPLRLQIENSRVLHIFAGERDIAGELDYLTNKRRELVLTEMAVSTNAGVVPENIDWTKNAQLNEGAIGIHMGLGDGLTGAHVDFICPGAELKN